MARPNLFVIGAMKSGTTSLHTYLDAHPSIFMVPNKEPTHFVDGEELRVVSPVLWKAGFWQDRDRYLALFDEAGDAPVVGESSTNYSKLPSVTGVAERIAEFDPEARVVYIMRDPIERTISHYWHLASWHGESRDLLTAVKRDRRYRAVSHYAMQLAPYLACFGAERVRTLTLEALKSDPRAAMEDLFAWLGVDAEFVPPNLEERKNVSEREVEQVRGLGLLNRFRHSRVWDRVGPLVPPAVRTVGRRLAERRTDRGALDTDATIAYLRPLQQAETRELAGILNREFSEWTTLYPDAAESGA